MTILGMVLGGIAGLLLGGPVYGIVGAFAGHLFDRYRAVERRNKKRRRAKAQHAGPNSSSRPLFDDPTETRRIAFATAIIVLSAKLAKADGVVSRDEINAFKRRFMISDQDVGGVARIYDEAKRSADGYQPYARQLVALFGRDPILLEELLIGLFEVAKADGELTTGETAFLREVSKIFGFDAVKFEQIRATFSATSRVIREPQADLDHAFRILGLSRSASNDEVKTAYRKLVRELHPDKLMAKGLPKEFISRSNDRLAAVNAAYDKISKQRGIK